MKLCERIKMFLLKNYYTFKYSLFMLFVIAFQYVKNIFKKDDRVLEPPRCISDPKYGVHKYVVVNNVKLHYVEKGDPSKTLMLFLHGFPELWYSWRHQITDLSKDFWCVAVDMRGYGESEKPSGKAAYNINILAKDIRELIRQLGREKCVLVSHDWGGLVAGRFRDNYPDALHAVIALASATPESWYQEIQHNKAQRKMSWYVFFFRCPLLPELLSSMNLSMFNILMQGKGKEYVTDEDIDVYKYYFGQKGAFTPPINYYRALTDIEITEKERSDLAIPHLLALAADDPYISRNIAKTMEKHYAHLETTIIEGCNHFCQQEDPEKINKLIREFLIKHNVK